ncbi:hypothetical protein EJ06DRAFT_471971 [Trichodelitschia bisporula]|uniref:Zn(2)-C6 fungal-type domain-containing protein n=1 Tax=Trichodelitschia bisporula TaxID=703511 RepID=A0A6G1I7H0_9PEZI|nr:hypothetical protein EJ06DRAFT_471971 [Trichodelitschia bisporula]
MARPNNTPIPIAVARPPPQRRVPSKDQSQPQQPLVHLKAASPFVAAAGVANHRTRRERPCDACRRRKSRCVINEGASLCVLCEFHKQDCTFVQDPQPRKRKVPTDEPRPESSPKKRSIGVESARPSPPTSVGKPASSPRQRPAVIQRLDIGHVLTESLGLQTSKHGRYIGLTSPFDSTLIGLSQFDSRNESILALGTLRRVNDHDTFIMFSDDTSRDYGSDADILQAIHRVVAPHGPALIDLYFRVVHDSFPILQKQIFLERYRSPTHTVSPPLLAGMYILALNWWSHDSTLAPLPRPDVTQLESIASISLAAAMQRPKLSTVQAGLLLLQRPEADSWSLTTQLVAIGQELGLHLDCTTWSIPQWEVGLRKRIAWALYMQDKWSSLIHGRPSHIFSANWAVKPITPEDEADEASPAGAAGEEDKAEAEKGQILFRQMISLTAIMAEIMDTFYTQIAIQDFANAGRDSTRLILERAKPVQIKLKEWFSKLPAVVRMDNVTPKHLSSTGFLHLAYFATEITLHRRIVGSLDTTNSDPYLLYICRSAAKTRLISAMDFVNRLRPEHLQAFWYFPSKINFTLIGTFGGLLWATAPAKEEADFYRTRLREYRWTLSVSSDRADFLDYAVQMLDTSRSMLRNLADKPSLAQMQAQTSSVGVPAVPRPAAPARRAESGAEQEERAGDVSPPLTRNTSVSVFSGFSSEALDQYQEETRNGPDTPPSSVG